MICTRTVSLTHGLDVNTKLSGLVDSNATTHPIQPTGQWSTATGPTVYWWALPPDPAELVWAMKCRHKPKPQNRYSSSNMPVKVLVPYLLCCSNSAIPQELLRKLTTMECLYNATRRYMCMHGWLGWTDMLQGHASIPDPSGSTVALWLSETQRPHKCCDLRNYSREEPFIQGPHGFIRWVLAMHR